MRKKIIVTLLATSMLLGSLLGCSKTQESVEGNEGSNEKVVLNVGIPQNVNISDYDDNSLTKYLEETLNMDLKFQFFSSSSSEYAQQLALMSASEERLPDVLWGFTGLGRSMMNQYGEDGYFVDLTDLIEEHAVHYKAKLASLTKEEQKLILSRGKNVNNGAFYAMPTYTSSNVADYMQNMMFINQEWLNKVGMNAPTNIDELYNVLKAFKTKDPNGNGQADEVPMLSSNIWLYVINAFVYYDESNPWNVTDGKVWNPVTTDEYRNAMIYLNKLCSEGLLNDLSLTASGVDIKNMISGSGNVAKVGVWCGHPSVVTTTTCEVLDQYVALRELGDASGNGGYGVQVPNLLAYGGFITKDCENQEAAMRFLDLFYDDTTAIWLRHGQKGVDWEEGSGESVFGTESVVRVLNSQAFFEGNSTWGNTGTTIMTPLNNLAIAEKGTGREAESARLLKELMEVMLNFNRPKELAVHLIYTDAEQAVKDQLEATYLSYIKEARSLFIKGTKNPNSDADWKEYLDTIKQCGAEDLMKAVQSAYTATYK